jgi:ABC-type nitrate/sulfonate/bicarbonate transport system substrate-binding protein
MKCLIKPALLVLAFSLGSVSAGTAEEQVHVKIGRLAFPSMGTIMNDIVKAKGFDKKHGIDLEVITASAISGYYGALANGEVDMTAGGPLVFQKMISEGVHVRVGFTWARMNILSVVSNNPAIKSVADLKGKSIAATMGSSEYQTLAVYGRTQGLEFGKDITVVNASPPIARTQLEAGRVEAALLWEPTTTIALRENPQIRVVLDGDQAWSAIAATSGWDLVLGIREDFLKSKPHAMPKLEAMFQEALQWYSQNLDEADKILVDSIKLPPGTFKASVQSGRLAYDIKLAYREEDSLWKMFQVAVESGYMPKLPDKDVIYRP